MARDMRSVPSNILRFPATTPVEPVGGTVIIEEFEAHMRRQRMAANSIKLRMHYLARFAKTVPDLLTATETDVETFMDSLRHLSLNTNRCALASLKKFYKWATHKGYVSDDPTFYLPPIMVPHRESSIASEDQISMALYEGTREQQAMIRLGAECGLRASEIASLHRDSRDDEWLRIVGKGGRQRILHVSAELAELLDSIERRGMRRGFYFPSECEAHHIHLSTVWRNIRHVLNNNPHSLRHRAGTTVYYQGGKDIRLAQLFLGHSSSATTEVYVHVGLDRLREAGEVTRFKNVIDHPHIQRAA